MRNKSSAAVIFHTDSFFGLVSIFLIEIAWSRISGENIVNFGELLWFLISNSPKIHRSNNSQRRISTDKHNWMDKIDFDLKKTKCPISLISLLKIFRLPFFQRSFSLNWVNHCNDRECVHCSFNSGHHMKFARIFHCSVCFLSVPSPLQQIYLWKRATTSTTSTTKMAVCKHWNKFFFMRWKITKMWHYH